MIGLNYQASETTFEFLVMQVEFKFLRRLEAQVNGLPSVLLEVTLADNTPIIKDYFCSDGP